MISVLISDNPPEIAVVQLYLPLCSLLGGPKVLILFKKIYEFSYFKFYFPIQIF